MFDFSGFNKIFSDMSEKMDKIFNTRGKISVDGKVYEGTSLKIKDGRIWIDGKEVTSDSKQISIKIEGGIGSLHVDHCEKVEVTGDVNELTLVSGNVKCANVTAGIETTSGSVNCANVFGDINTKSGRITNAGNVDGSVETLSGSVECGNVKGKVSTMSGRISYKQ